MLVAAAAMAFASCQKEENIAPETISATLTMHADVDATKTYLGEGNTVLWGTGESVHLYVGSGETSKFVASASTDEYNGNASASFTFDIQSVEIAETYSLGGIYPASAAVTSSNTNPAKYKVQLPATQQSVDGNYDPAAYIMVLKPETVNELPEEYTASFRRATALNKITLTNVTENITSVEITVPEGKYLAGRRNFDLTTGESGEIYDSGTETNVVKVIGDFKAGNVDVWFCSWGVELVENDNLTVKLTSAAKSYTRSITVRAEGINFHEGGLNKLTINMGHEDTVVETLTKIEGEYLIASKTSSGWFLMTPSNGGSFYDATSSVSSASEVTCSSFYDVTDVEKYVWEVAKYDNAYSIQSTSTEKYVSYSGSGNTAAATNTLGAPIKMSIELNGQSATIESMNVAGRKLQYNAGSPRFAFYTSAQTSVYMIPWVPDETPRISVTETEYNVLATDTSVEIPYTVKNITGAITAAVADGATMTIVSTTVEEGIVIVTFDANEDSEDKTAIIVLSYDGATSVNVTLNQGRQSSEGDVVPSGTVLWSETWADAGKTSSTFTDQSAISTYNYAGRTGFGDNASNVTYTADASNNVRITKSSGANCTSGHLWFNKSVTGELKTSAIKLYGATSLSFSHSQGTSGSACQTSYSVDGGSTWTSLGTQSGAIATKTYTFTVPDGTESIMIKLTHDSSNNKNTRVDNLELKAN